MKNWENEYKPCETIGKSEITYYFCIKNTDMKSGSVSEIYNPLCSLFWKTNSLSQEIIRQKHGVEGITELNNGIEKQDIAKETGFSSKYRVKCDDFKQNTAIHDLLLWNRY